MKIAVACGGTGGHIFPGLSTARVLQQRGHDVSLWLSGRDVEAGSVAGWSGAIVRVQASGLPTGVSLRSLQSAWSMARAAWESRAVMRTLRPAAVLAMGSYASVGPVLAAWSLRIPVVLHEANVVPGRALSFLSRLARCVAVSFPQTARYVNHRRVVHTGYPVRRDLDGTFDAGQLDPSRFTVLVMGGSQGATFLNQTLVAVLRELRLAGQDVQAIHLAGTRDADWVEAAYRDAGIPHLVYPFLREVGKAYHAAHLLIGRAGAGGCFEALACRVPSLLIPLPTARRDHQLANALALRELAGVDVMEQKHVTVPILVAYVRDCMEHRERLDTMRRRMEAITGFDGVEALARLVEEESTGAGGASPA